MIERGLEKILNNINKLQNDINALEAQAAARYYYNTADKCDFVSLMISIILVISNMYFINNEIVITLQILWFFIYIFIDRTINSYVDKGATLKNSFDYYVYGWKSNFSTQEKDLIKELRMSKSEFLKVQIKNDGFGTIGGVKDWHTNIDSGLTQHEAIKKAMKNNVEVNGILMKKSKVLLSILFIAGIVYITWASRGLTAFELLIHIFITFSVLPSKIIETNYNIKKIDELNLISNTMLEIDEVNNLKDIQSKIDDKRKVHFPLDYLFYTKMRSKVHDILSSS